MKLNVISFVLGAICTLAALTGSRKFFPRRSVPIEGLRFTANDLVGTWHGKESWGVTYVVVRNADGTFVEDMDSSKADVRWSPPVVHAKGRWSLQGGNYIAVYDERSDHPPTLARPSSVVIRPASPTSFTYCADEGNPVEEHKP